MAVTDFVAIPDWALSLGGCGVAAGELDGAPVAVVLAVARQSAPVGGRYRVGRELAGGAPQWGPWREVPDWPAPASVAGGLALWPSPAGTDLVVFALDGPAGPDFGWYRVGHGLAADGTVAGWEPWRQVPDWFAWENQGADITLADLSGTGRTDLVVAMLDAPAGPNTAYYRVGHDLAPDGTVRGGWGPWIAVPDSNTWENQGLGIAVVDLLGDGGRQLLVGMVDNPAEQNTAICSVGWALDADGRAGGGWGPWGPLDGWRFWENAGVSFSAVPGAPGRLLVLTVDNPAGAPQAYWRLVDIPTDLDEAATRGAWRLLDFPTEVNPVHAALLHTGDVLLFAGSGNDPNRQPPRDFRTRLWHYPSHVVDAPATPLDLFCCGHAMLPDGRLLAAGGTGTYDPFHGLKDTVVFDPVTAAWSVLPDMAHGRWYPALTPLPDGRVLALSGLDEAGVLTLQPEVFDPAAGGWVGVGSPGAWPLYAHLVVLTGGRVFYPGGQYGGNNGVRPSVWDMGSGAVTDVPGLTAPDMRNQSASVLLPPAQLQRVMLVGGGGADMHNQGPAVPDTALVDLAGPAPAYRPGPALHHGRMHLCAVLLPDRTVLVTGGSQMEEMAGMAAPHAEVFDPVTETWHAAAASRVPRLYHSVALLLPDGRVMSAGSNPARGVEEMRIEVFSPAYLFAGPRPHLTLAAATATFGTALAGATGGADVLASVGLVRPGATTHSSNNEQRLVDVPFTAQPDGSLVLQLPADPGLAPPGWYLVFAVNDAGVPSEGVWLQLTAA